MLVKLKISPLSCRFNEFVMRNTEPCLEPMRRPFMVSWNHLQLSVLNECPNGLYSRIWSVNKESAVWYKQTLALQIPGKQSNVEQLKPNQITSHTDVIGDHNWSETALTTPLGCDTAPTVNKSLPKSCEYFKLRLHGRATTLHSDRLRALQLSRYWPADCRHKTKDSTTLHDPPT